MARVTNDKFVSWLIPAIMTGTMAILGWVGNTLNKISESLAVVVYKVENHEKRIDYLERTDIRSRP